MGELKPISGRAFTARSIGLGLLGVAALATLAPYNDWIVENSFLVGSYLPLAVMLWMFVLVVLVNAALHRWLPAHAIRSGELVVVLAMMLAASATAGQGLFRQVLPMPIAMHYWGQRDATFWAALTKSRLPPWLFAAPLDSASFNDVPFKAFYGRLLPGESVPWAAWVVPLCAWGVLVVAFFTAQACLAILIRPQWADNERLAFPLSQLQAMLIEPPAAGKGLNRLFRSRSFWVACGAVFAVHSLTAGHALLPQTIPQIPLGFDFRDLLSNEPYSFLPDHAKRATIYFTFIGVCYFIPSKVAFSLWFFYWLQMVLIVRSTATGAAIPGGAWLDQQLGAAIAMFAGILFIGRSHWARVLRQMVSRPRANEPTGRYVSFRWAGWTLAVSTGVMFAWFVAIGTRPWFAVVLVAFMLMAHVIVARIVALTGLPFIRLSVQADQLYSSLPIGTLGARDVYAAGTSEIVGVLSTRESLLAFSQGALQTNESLPPNDAVKRRGGLVAVLAIGLAVALLIGAWSHLSVYYHFAQPITTTTTGLENGDGLSWWPQSRIRDPINRNVAGHTTPKNYSPATHLATGLVVMAGLQWGSLSFANWWLAPIGYLTANSFYIQTAWFSLILGWLLKVLVVRFGGAGLYAKARPVFVGLIFGEALAAGVWLVIILVATSQGVVMERIRLLPS